MLRRKIYVGLFSVALGGLAASPALSVTQACKKNPNHCQIAELCAVLGNGKYSQKYPKYARRLESMNIKCQPDLTPYGYKPTQNTRPSVLQISFQKLSLDDRKLVQQFLKAKGHYGSAIDGLFGANTRAALMQHSSEVGGYDLAKESEADALLQSVLSGSVRSKEQQENNENAIGQASPRIVEAGYGTAFFVSAEGHAVTNHHVTEGCVKVSTRINGVFIDAAVVANDPLNDLALLKFPTKPDHVFTLSDDSPYPLQEIVVVGFPFGEQVSSTVKFTRGIVSSVAGIANNFSQIQVDAAMQPGNSGGPILDEYGNVVAVSVSKLSLKKTIQDYGVVPENINFGIKASLVKNLLDGNTVQTPVGNGTPFEPRKLAEFATLGVILLTCFADGDDY